MTESVHIEKVLPSTPQEKEFIQLPFIVYKNNPHFVPWFNRSLKQIIAGRHPYFNHSQGEFFIARRDKETVARIALLEPKKFNDYQGKKDARFYFFETKDDLRAVSELFSFAEDWARKRKLNRITGPQGFSGFTGAGILVDGFDETAAMTMMNYHLPYYRELIEGVGFEKYKDFFSAEINAELQCLPQKYRIFADLAMKRGRFHTPELKSKKELQVIAREIGELYNNSFGDREEFCPMTRAEIDFMMDDLITATDPSLVKILRHGEELAGFILAFPDISESMKQAEGRLTPLTIRSMMKEKKRTTRFLINGIGILPKYQKSGGIAILFNEITKALRANNVSRAEMTQIAETTDLMISSIRKLDARIYKTHRVYEKHLS